ncbi:MAG: ATP-binding protein [Alphaproteobacteria bacterium]|nr:ATP-binding protein [Alphaproteobacteria bacterium]
MTNRLAHRMFDRLVRWMTPRVLPTAGGNKLALMRRMFQALAVLTALGLVAVLAPYFAGDSAGMIIGGLLAASLLGMSGTVWWQIKHMHDDAAEEILLREAFHSMLTPQLIVDYDGNIVMANRAFRGWIDLGSRPVMEALKKRFGGTPDNEEKFRLLSENLQEGQSVIADLPVMRGTRIIEWRRIIARPIDGHNRYCHWRFEDISERRRMERAMQDEQNKLLDFMAHAPVGIFSVDQHGRFKFVNETMAQWLQVTPDELVRGDVRIHDIMNEAPLGVSAYAVTGGPHGELRGEVVFRRRDGSLFPVAITQTVVACEDGKSLRTRSIVRDLSPEREWQMALSLSEYRFQRLFAEAPIGILLLDSKFAIMECNQAFLKISRQKRESVISRELADLILQSDREGALKELSHILGGTDLVKPIEVHMQADREITAHVFARRFVASSPTPDVEGQEGLMLYFIDVTEQKRLETQFAQSMKMQAIGQLAGGVAHDFNNLLTAMIGFCDLLLQRHKPGDQSFTDIMQIKQNGNRAANLVRQLLAFSRQQTLQPKVINIVDVVSELTNLLRRLIGAQIQLNMNHGRDIGLVKCDQGQLEQVIINLVVNARDAMPEGGTVLVKTYNHIQNKPTHHGQDEMPPGRYVGIEVADTGCGIPKEIITRVFEPFFSTKEVGSGTGLGLSTVYGVVRQTGGFIDVESKVGKGTRFVVYLPVLANQEQVTAAVANDDESEEKPGPDLTGAGSVLLVEDEDAVRVFSTRALKNKGYNVFEARSGEEAVDVLKNYGEQIDLIVTDVVMPQMDGPTLYKHVKEKWPHIKVVFVSGYTEDRLREQFKSGEEIHFLSKPFSLKQLAGKVKELLSEG